jgi:hypothetical protein
VPEKGGGVGGSWIGVVGVRRRGGRRRIGRRLGSLGRAWWLWKWLDEEVLRNADRGAVAGL